jgi:uncharacterized protein YggE
MPIRHLAFAWLAASSMLVAANVRADDARPRTVSVGGQGEITAQPDMARVTLGVEARNPALSAARAQVAETVDRVLALTRSLGIDAKYVNATGVQVQPEYDWNDKDRTRRLLGYRVSRQVDVELRDLDKLGTLIERAIDAGVNLVGDPTLDSTERKSLERQALALAVRDARANAETLATAAGGKLGAVRTLSAAFAPMPIYRARAAMADAAAPEANYQAGEMRFTASVTAEYDILVAP